MKPPFQYCSLHSLWVAAWLVTASVALGQGDDRFIGIWIADQGYQTVELLFRSDGVYQMDTRSADPGSDFGYGDRGRYQVAGQSLTLTSYVYNGEPVPVVYEFELVGDSLTLASASSSAEVYQLEPGSRAEVLARESANPALVRRWTRNLLFFGDEEYTFRPGGYYCLKRTPENPELLPEFERGRYEQAGNWLTVQPYSADESYYEVDIFGTTLTLIETNGWSGWYTSYEEVGESYAEVTTKAAEAQAFLSSPDWQAGIWQIQLNDNTVHLLLRPDGVYSATNTIPAFSRVLRGRYTLAGAQMHLVPFVGQERYTLDEANFGIAEQTYTVDYYDSELQLIDLAAYTQSVKVAHELPGSHAAVLATATQGQTERQRDGWYLGIWQTEDPDAWMEFTFRPDGRYIAKSGSQEVERGWLAVAGAKITLAPYPGNGAARGFEYDLFDGDLFLIGDAQRLVVVRKVAGSESEVIDKTQHPVALEGERGSILGLWTAHRPTESVELVLRQDGQFRLQRCANNVTSYDYGLYEVDMASRRLVWDSRFTEVQTQHLDFYGETMTIYGGLSNTTPSTYTVNLGTVDAAIAGSLAADAQEAQVDAQWLGRVPIAPMDPDAVPPSSLPPDPHPGQIFQGATVFSGYKYYRRLIPHLLFYPNANGTDILGVIDSQQWHFMPMGRVLVRFVSYRAGWPYPMTWEDVTEVWGAYEIGPKPTGTDILHRYADNTLTVLTDAGEQVNMTLEDGRRNLFWGKNANVLGDWATEQVPIACQMPGNPDASLMNTGVSLWTDLTPDPTGDAGPVSIAIAGAAAASVTVSGTTERACSLVVEAAASLAAPITWEPLQSNSVPAGPFSFTISGATNAAGFYRVRSQ